VQENQPCKFLRDRNAHKGGEKKEKKPEGRARDWSLRNSFVISGSSPCFQEKCQVKEEAREGWLWKTRRK
jgi:hypothetical protein